ncbi:hypothetical protein TNCV_1611191 [Trichonephila clavipes]|nr:hypothetical protein TNCV_1611191 [Trichonephila clavipes]
MSKIKDDPQKMWKRRIIDMKLNYHARPIQKNVGLSRRDRCLIHWATRADDSLHLGKFSVRNLSGKSESSYWPLKKESRVFRTRYHDRQVVKYDANLALSPRFCQAPIESLLQRTGRHGL